MVDLPSLAVTGATGAVGGRVARLLAEQGAEQRLLVRAPERAPALPGAIPLPMDYADRAVAEESLHGVRTLFLVSGTESPDRLEQHRTVIEAATAAGVEHVVYTSFYGADPDATFTFARDHAATEGMLLASGMDTTLLRDNFYLDIIPFWVGEDDVIRGPAGDGRVAAVARDDVARVAVAALTGQAAHRGATYHLTGPEALSFAEVAAILSEHTGRTITYHDETVEEAYESRRTWPAEQWEYDAWVSTYTAIAHGELAGVTDDVERVTGRAPVDLRAYLSTR